MQKKNITPNIFYDARGLDYQFGNDILCLIVFAHKAFGKCAPVTICATDKNYQDKMGIAQYGWKGIARYFEGYEESCNNKILFFDYDKAFDSYKMAFNKRIKNDAQ